MKKGPLIAVGILTLFAIIGAFAPKKDRMQKAEAAAKAEPEVITAPPAPVKAPEPIKATEPLEVLNAKASYDDYRFDVKGTVKNNSKRDYRYAQIVFAVYDSSDAKVGTAMANIGGLAAGETWKFTAMCLCPTGRKWKLDKVTSF